MLNLFIDICLHIYIIIYSYYVLFLHETTVIENEERTTKEIEETETDNATTGGSNFELEKTHFNLSEQTIAVTKYELERTEKTCKKVKETETDSADHRIIFGAADIGCTNFRDEKTPLHLSEQTIALTKTEMEITKKYRDEVKGTETDSTDLGYINLSVEETTLKLSEEIKAVTKNKRKRRRGKRGRGKERGTNNTSTNGSNLAVEKKPSNLPYQINAGSKNKRKRRRGKGRGTNNSSTGGSSLNLTIQFLSVPNQNEIKIVKNTTPVPICKSGDLNLETAKSKTLPAKSMADEQKKWPIKNVSSGKTLPGKSQASEQKKGPDKNVSSGKTLPAKSEANERKKVIVDDKDVSPKTTSTLTNADKYVAMDCEMVGVGSNGQSNMLARVSIVNKRGEVLIDKFVKPQKPVTDYRTSISGIRPGDLNNGENIKKVRREVVKILHGKILVGHGLNRDLAALHINHPQNNIRDTALYKPLNDLLPKGYIPSLKRLCLLILGKEIQTGEHNSVEDARAAMSIYNHLTCAWEHYIKTHPYK